MSGCGFPYCEERATAELRTTRDGLVERVRRYCDGCAPVVLRVQPPAGTHRTVHLIDGRGDVAALPGGQAHCPRCYGNPDCTFCDGTGVVGDAARWVGGVAS